MITITESLVAEALAEARSTRPVDADTPAGPAGHRWTGEWAEPSAGGGALDLGRVLEFSLKAGTPDLDRVSGVPHVPGVVEGFDASGVSDVSKASGASAVLGVSDVSGVVEGSDGSRVSDVPNAPGASAVLGVSGVRVSAVPGVSHLPGPSGVPDLSDAPDAPGVSTRLRPVASAGALHPVNAHLLVGPGCSLPPGRYAYDPLEHRACLRGPAPADAPPGVIAVLTVTAQRTVSHYGHRAWPLLLLDTGHAAAALAMAAIAHGHRARVTLNADAAGIAAAAGLPAPGRWHATWAGTTPEHPLAAVHITLGARADGTDSCPLTAWAVEPLPAPPRPGPAPGPAGLRAGAVLEVLTRSTAPAGWWSAEPPYTCEGPSLARAIARRRSSPPPLNGQPDSAALAAVLTSAGRSCPGGPAWCAAIGDPPGLVAADPEEPRALRLIADGEARPTLAVWAARQGWLAEAGAVLLGEGVPGDASAEQVRVGHLAAGYAAACAELTATALGLRTRPIGSWQAADLGAALGGRAGRRWVLHGLAVAAPLPAAHSRSDR